MLSTFFISLALLPFALAQESSDIKAIEAHFTQSHLVPDLFASFNPSALLSLDYAGEPNFPQILTFSFWHSSGVGVVQPGQLLTKERTLFYDASFLHIITIHRGRSDPNGYCYPRELVGVVDWNLYPCYGGRRRRWQQVSRWADSSLACKWCHDLWYAFFIIVRFQLCKTINKGSTVANSSATAITGYAGPYPASGSGPHRHVHLFPGFGKEC